MNLTINEVMVFKNLEKCYDKILRGDRMGLIEIYVDIPKEHAANIFGELDLYLKKIERSMNVTVAVRAEGIKLIGNDQNVQLAKRIFEELLDLSKKNGEVTEHNVDYTISLMMENQTLHLLEVEQDIVTHTIAGKPIRTKTLGQKNYIDSIRKQMIVFGVGPAGTGKTYLAMAMAIQAFKSGEVGRIILTRPAIEAGEKLGFLPGDLQSKVDPYLRPLYDALYQIMGTESFARNMEKGLIEVAPLAYMRGRTLDNSFIILDEAQNTTPAQMKMFLTRIGFGSKVIITGDITQKDLPIGAVSGLDVALKVLSKVDGIGMCKLTSADVVRHPLVQKIVQAYDAFEAKQNHHENKNHRVSSERKKIK